VDSFVDGQRNTKYIVLKCEVDITGSLFGSAADSYNGMKSSASNIKCRESHHFPRKKLLRGVSFLFFAIYSFTSRVLFLLSTP
jgi:hypothetical protein